MTSKLVSKNRLSNRLLFLGAFEEMAVIWLCVLGLWLLLSSNAQAQFSTGFESGQSSGSPAYTSGSTIIGVQDVTARAGNKWVNMVGTTSTSMTLTTSNPASGSRTFEINDTSTSTAYGAYVDLTGAIGLDLAQPFTISFAMNLSGISSGTGNQAQFYFGNANTDPNTGKYWAAMIYSNGVLYLLANNANGNGAAWINLGNYTTFDTTGANYVTVSLTVDPLLKRYTKVVLSGSGVTTDFTSTVQAVNGGIIPWLSAVNPTVNPEAKLIFVTGTNDTLRAKFDGIQVANATQGYEIYAPGVIFPDQGTIEMTLSLSRPISQLGNSTAYDFLFKVLPAQKLSTGRTLMGLCVPAAGSGTGLLGLVRNATGSTYVSNGSFAPTPGQLVRVAMSWGSRVKLYVNGGQVSDVASSIGNLTPMPALFRVEQMDPFCISEIKISDVQLATTSLSGTASVPLAADVNTTLLATSGLKRTQYFHTARHASTTYSSLTPRWRMEDQSYAYGSTPSYTLVGINHTGATKTYSVNISVTDRLGASVLNSTTSVGILGDNSYRLTTLPLSALASVGYYKLRTTITNPSAVATVYDSAIAVFPANDTTVADGAWDKYLGYHYQLENFSPVVLNRMGIKTNRVFGDLSGFYWYSVQPIEGTGANGFTWARTDLLVQQARAAGIDLIGLLGNPPPWAAQDPGATYKASYPSYSLMSGRWKPRNNAEWGNYVYQVVSRYKNVVKNWEIWNEVDWHPNCPYYSFSGSTAEYHELLKVAYAQAKAADPTCNVLISGFSAVSGADVNMPYDLLNTMTSSTPFDTFASHAYDNSRVDSLNTALYAKKGANAPHWMTEQVWDSVSYEPDRLFLTVELYLRFLDKGIDRFYQFDYNGICFDENTFSPKIDAYVQGVFQNQMRKVNSYSGKYTFTGSDAFSVRHYFTRTDGKILSMLGSELNRNMVTVSGAIISAVDSYGKNLTKTVSANTALDIADVAYIVSTSSLNITGVQLIQGAPLLLNTGFEDIAGDLQTGGLPSCTPLNWTFRKTTYDPQGQINLTTSSHGGAYGLTIYSSGIEGIPGNDRVYAFQDTRIASAGTYRATAYFRRPNANETAIPFISYFNRDTNVVTNQTYSNIVAGGAYTQATLTMTFSAPQIQSGGVSVGVYQGTGTVLVDDVTFERISP